ncbi:MAG: alpha/beta hydrolase [Hyphomonadaceae bacterium]|nr:alpha/beta hydrolase [Hyphomonadaceae bacterium]
MIAAPAWAERPALERQAALGPLPETWRSAEVIDLWRGTPPNGGFHARPLPPTMPPGFFRNVARPTLHVFKPATGNGRGVLLIPGGAYEFVVGTHEGAATAEALGRLGYSVFVLVYRLPGEGWRTRWNVPLQDAQRAMRVVRANAQRFGISEHRIVALGYSAGGHLAASLATAYAEPVYPARDRTDAFSARPSAAGLIYPVITLRPPHTHAQSAAALLGPAPSAELVAMRSPELHVTDETPPVFLAHALDDTAVPVENTIMMLEAMRARGRPVEAHLFEEGGHGFGLGAPNAPAGQWLTLFDAWLARALSDE